MRTYSKLYPFKVWLSTLFLAPISLGIYFFIAEGMPKSFNWNAILLLLLGGLVLSLPTLVFYYLVYVVCSMNGRSPTHIRIASALTALIGLFITAYLLFTSYEKSITLEDVIFFTPYILGILVFGFLYNTANVQYSTATHTQTPNLTN